MNMRKLIHVPTVWSLAHKAGLRVAGVYWPATTAAPIESVFSQSLPDAE